MEEQQHWIIEQALYKGVQFVQKYDHPFHDYSYSFWDILEKSMAKDLAEHDFLKTTENL